jgi:hypothetical protein
VLGVVLLRAVGHLDDQPPGVADQNGQGEVACDEVRVDRKAEHPQPVLQVVLPDGRVPLEELLSAPDVVHEHIETLAFGINPLDERFHLARLQMVDRHCDPIAAGVRHELGGFLDRLRPVVLRTSLGGAAARAVDRRACLSERDRRAPSGSAGRAGDERDLAVERSSHWGNLAAVRRPHSRRTALAQ